MVRFVSSLRALAAGLALAALSVGCQAVFGDFKIDDGAFQGSGAGAGGGSAGGDNTSGGAGVETGGDGGVVVQGPIQLDPTSGLYTTEWGGQAKFTIVLERQPKADVTVALSSSNTNEGTVSPKSVVFTKDDWNAPQLVTVTGVDDTIKDPNTPYAIKTAPAVSDDPSYSGVDALDEQLYNVDNETAGVTVAPTSGLVTSESGMQDTFTVVLNSPPMSDVTIALTSSKPGEGTPGPASLVFTSVNWMAPQLVTVTGVDDTAKDGPQPYEIDLVESSKDPSYDGHTLDSVKATNLDNETAGITVVLVKGIDANDKTKLITSENGDTATFTVQLVAPPSGDVVIPLSSDNPKEATVSQTSLTFTTLNWMAPQTVTVTGVDDGKVVDGNQPFNIVLGVPMSSDKDYAKLAPTKVPGTNTDNDKAGFTITLVSGLDKSGTSQLLTDEGGGTATFTIALNTQPSDSVTIGLSSSTPTEGTVSPASLTFTKDNWNGPQTVTVKGVDDKVQDGSPQYFIRTSQAMSNDKDYSVLDPDDVTVTNRDNDTAGVVITFAGGIDPLNNKQLTTSESGDNASFLVTLASQPTQDVTITFTSSNVKEGTVAPASMKFTAANYAAPQQLTIYGVDDPVPTADGNQVYYVVISPPSSKDPNYNAPKLGGSQVTVTNRDNDSAGFVVNPTSGLVTSEAGLSATFTVKLSSLPSADVTIPVSSNNTAEGTVNVSSLKFTALSWNAPQTVTVTGVQDNGTADGPQPYKVILGKATSADPGYGGPLVPKPSDVSVTNRDDDTAGILITPTMGLITSESGATATFAVTLQSRPTAPVKITLKSSNTAEGTISPSVLTFTPANYNSPQVVTITGVNDPQPIQDGPQPYTITANGGASSTDPNYNTKLAPDVSVTNTDNDSAGITITPLPTTLNPGVTTESGGTSTFSVVLNSVPMGNVTFTVTSLNLAEGTVAPGTLSFTPANWNGPQTVTVKGVDDAIVDNNQPYNVRLSAAASPDPNYNGKFGVDLPFVNDDNDHAGYVVNAANTLQTSESGATATFTVMLLSQPTSNVTIGLSSSNTAEGTVSPASLVFTTTTWNVAQTVTVTGVDDHVADGPQPYSIALAGATSADPNYSGNFATSVPPATCPSCSLTNIDNDTPGFVLAGTMGLQTSESGGMASFTVALATQPAGTNTVTLPVSSSNTAEGTVMPSSLTFTSADWSTPHPVTITGVDDKIADGPQPYSIVLGPASGDPGYLNKSPPSVSVTNADNDHSGVSVTPTTCSTTPGTTATFSVVLNSQPGDTVTINLASDTPTEGTIDKTTLVFSTDNWNVAQVVTVTGVDDGTMMSAMTQYKIVTMNASSPGDTTGYNGADVADVVCTNTTTAPPPP
jgi:hypothetical protein